jgi:hypothetical protein
VSDFDVNNEILKQHTGIFLRIGVEKTNDGVCEKELLCSPSNKNLGKFHLYPYPLCFTNLERILPKLCIFKSIKSKQSHNFICERQCEILQCIFVNFQQYI